MPGVNESRGEHEKLTEIESGIGCLPDSMLGEILSYVPMKYAVATSVLARRWRFLWTHVPKIEFDMHDIVKETKSGNSPSDVVNRILLLNESRCLKSFRLNCGGYNQYPLDLWIRSVLERNIQEIFLVSCGRFMLPACLFSCKTLIELTLHECVLRVPRAACLPSLKNLSLEEVEFENNETLPNLISGCSRLESLSIEAWHEEYGGLLLCNISSLSLIHLYLCFRRKTGKKFGPEQKLVLDTPALRYLTVYGGLSQHILARNLCSVVRADIDRPYYNTKEDHTHLHNVIALVERLCNVKYLRLSDPHVMKNFDSLLLSPTLRFDNLTELAFCGDWRLLSKLLQCADKLEVLRIGQVVSWREPENNPMCL